MADVGLLGFPNAGKSTMLSHLSNAKPKVADYPFTTIKPMVGVCELDVSRTMILADIPGLIEGASNGIGLGCRFLRHLERVRVLCHLIDGSEGSDLMERFQTINRELALYSERLATLEQVVVINKMDVLDDEQAAKVDEFCNALVAQGITPLRVSAVVGTGLHELKEVLFSAIGKLDDGGEKILLNRFDPTMNLY
jgi:GTP-binding protein